MAEGLGEFQSSEESGEVPSVTSVDKGKSDEEHVHLLPQEGSIATGSDTGTLAEQLQSDTIENLSSFNGEHEHSRLVDTAYSTSDPESDENNRDLLIRECYDELVGHEATSSYHACREIKDAQQEKVHLEFELGRRSFLEDKQKRNEKFYQSSRTRTNQQIKSCSASGASYDFTGMEGKLLGGAGLPQDPADSAFRMENAPEYEPRSHSTKPKIFHQTTEVIPPRNHNLDTLPENHTVEGDPMTETREKDTPMLEDQHGLSATAAECESWEHMNQPKEESQKCGTENQIPQDEFKTKSSCEGSQSLNGQKMLDGIAESPVIPARDYNLDLLSERQGDPSESLAGVHMQSNEGDHRVSGTNKAEAGSNMTCGNSDNCGSGMAVLPTNAVCDDLQQQPRDKWMRFGARPKTRPGPVKRTPLEPSSVEFPTCGYPDAVHVPVDSSESGISKEFIVRHSIDRSLLESLRHSGIENELTSDASLPGASYIESMMNNIEADRIEPHTVDDEVASRPGEHNRLSLSLLMSQDERGYAVGGSNQSLNGTTGPACTQNSDHLSNTVMGNIAHVVAAGSSNGALNGVLSEAESTAAHLYAPGNACSTCNLLNPAGDQVDIVSEPCRAESADFRDSMSDRNTVTDCNGINAALLVLAQRIHEVCVASGERQIEGEQQREARVRAWNSNRRFQGQAEDFIIESLDSTPNCARAQARREATIRASIEEMRRGPSSCSGPVEHSCVCLETDGCQACGVRGTIVPETCQRDPAQDKCCKCLQDVFIGSKILPCLHPVHTECLVSMIQNDELICPLCGCAFLGRS